MVETHRHDAGVDRERTGEPTEKVGDSTEQEHRAQTQAHRELTARVGIPLVRQKKGRRRLFGSRTTVSS
jgi:hypothetical protein